MISPQLQEILDGKIESPTLPEVIMRLLSAVDNPESTAPDIARIIGTDPALMVKVLKLVNSPFYGMPRQIATLTQATVVMGFSAIRNVALTIAVFDEFSTDSSFPKNFEYTREKLWEHSIAAAMTANVIATRINYSKKEDAFIAGLIHDIGKVVFDRYTHDDFLSALTLADAGGMCLFDAEREIIGETHAFIGSWLVDKWHLPPHLTDALRHHHAPEMSEVDQKLVTIVHLADALVREEGLGFAGDSLVPPIDSLVKSELGLGADSYTDIMQEVKRNFTTAIAFFQSVA
ncbi:MAG: HDOD domain-containing protein [Calditrichaeota bacterium]|nr:MAG: HDOD domain-containing protein [Calditrichota bacterium]